MTIELLTAGEILNKALGGIAAATAAGGAKVLWQKIKNRFQKDDSIQAEIDNLEQNPTEENLKSLEPFLHVEMHKDKLFAEEISNLAREIAKTAGDTITTGKIKAETGGVAGAKIDAPNSRFGGSDININVGKEQAQKKSSS